MSTFTPRSRARLDGLAIVICLLSAATAVVHLYLGVVTTVMIRNDPAGTAAAGGATALGVFAGLFYLSFLGYVVLTAALYHPATGSRRHLVRWALIVWTAGNLVAYFVLAQGHFDAFGLADKACELALIALLVVEGRRARS